jgi:hypothetical protein
MKTLAVVLSVISLARVGQGGETNQINLKQLGAPPGQAPREQRAFMGFAATNSGPYLLRARKASSGVLPELGRQKAKILRAPASPGRDFEHVSVNPLTGRPEGIIVYSIGF